MNWKRQDDFEDSRKILDNLKESWTIWDDPKDYERIKEDLEESWTRRDHPEYSGKYWGNIN